MTNPIFEGKEELAYNKIKQLYDNPKSHGFVVHLIRAFLPIYKSQKIFDNKKAHKCCILGEEVMSVDDQLSIVMNLDRDNFIRGMFDPEAMEKTREEIQNKKRGREVGYTAEHTDKCLSQSALQALLSFTTSEMLRGNREMHGLTRSMMRNGE